jgi:hypothetical protein
MGAAAPARRVIVAASALILGAGVSLLRQRGPGALDTLWAEDGEVFLQEAWVDPSPAGWLRGYAGYLHLAPRMLASLAAALPVDWAPLVLSGGAALAAAAVALLCHRAAEEHLPSPWPRALLALALLALPAVGVEVANAAANVHWYLLAALGWVSLWRPRSAAGWSALALFLFVSAASDPFTALVAPIFGWRLLRAPHAGDRAAAGALAAGLLLQGLVILGSAGTRPLDPLATSPLDLARWYGFHVLEGAVFGVRMRAALDAAIGEIASAALALLLLAALLAPAAARALRSGGVALVLAALHAGLFFVPAALAGTSPARYAVAPILLLYGLAAWGLASAGSRARRIAALPILVVAIAFALDFAPWNARADGPAWSAALRAASEGCASAGGSVRVDVPPTLEAGAQRRWSVEVPCRALEDGAAATSGTRAVP